MKAKLITAVTGFLAVLLVFTMLLAGKAGRTGTTEYSNRENILAVNEITQMAKAVARGEATIEELEQKSEMLQANMRESVSYTTKGKGTEAVWLMCLFCVVFLLLVTAYIYKNILSPFEKMKQYAEEIARGNLSVELKYDRANYFGAFTWAFDHMRREISKARSCEQEAIENNKTVIATLSHDIKTPIASIRAYAEGLEANLDRSVEKRQRYLSVIMKKCDEVAALTNDLFLHSLSDLEKLKIQLQPIEITQLLEEVLQELTAGKNEIQYRKPSFTATVQADRRRFVQVVGNLVHNAEKYANTKITVYMEKEEDSVSIHVRDYGAGIPDEDMPFIFDKFYRGKNCGEESGAGLGLFIVKYVLNQMGGEVKLTNTGNGLDVVLVLPIEENECE